MTDLLSPDGDIRDPYRGFIAKSRYSRWLPEQGRRETWTETVDRYMNFMLGHLSRRFSYIPDGRTVDEVRTAILQHEVMPSMRALMTAGEALERSPIAGFNCSYLPLADPESLDELLYILMNGTGVGFSVERRYVDQLPPVPSAIERTYAQYIHVADSKEGWAFAFRALLKALWRGQQPEWNLSEVRPAGARLRTFGGRASGPEPLAELFEFTVELFKGARGRKLRPIEVHDLACKVASVVVVGGVRRSAMISLSDLDDQEMAAAKTGDWWVEHPHRQLANNSAVYHDGMRREDFRTEWDNLVNSGSGERGIFHRDAARRQASRFGMRDQSTEYGTNPCSEIILRPYSFCNLSEVVVRADDNYTSLKRKVRIAATLGTWQSTLTEFPYLREEWRRNAEEERLLGVSLTGIYDSPILNGSIGQPLVNLPALLERLRDEVTITNQLLADELGINVSVATTCVKPSGTVSQLVDSASGLHQRHAELYIRRVRVDRKDPLAELMIDAGVPHEPDSYNEAAWVFSFPMEAPQGAVTRRDVSAIEHLELWAQYQSHWCEHKPSVTISVRPHEWDEVGEWVWEHLDEISGVSFLPFSEHTYKQAPYEECSEEVYEELVKAMPRLQWSDLVFYETTDGTVGSQELACSANGGCEVVDLTTAA
jgi:ribonucleoside-diphosphate reductase alpha chain